MTTKMTLSMDSSVVAKARRISKRRRTSISAMFSNYIASLEEEPSKDNELPPITKQILEMGTGTTEMNCPIPFLKNMV